MTKSSKASASGAYQSVGKTYDGVTSLKPKTKPKNVTAAQVRATIRNVVGNVVVERRPDGHYAVRRESAVAPTQKEMIVRALDLAPKKAHVARTRDTKTGGRGK